jgi:transcriptional regulator with XRE-family HTH domain
MATTKNALNILDRLTGKSAVVRREIADARINMEVAQMIYDARTEAGLTQGKLAELIGTRQSVIARLEDADYTGHSLTMLQKIAGALGHDLELRFVRTKRRAPRGTSIGARAKVRRTA